MVNVLLYTISGVVSSLAVGYGIGWLGARLIPEAVVPVGAAVLLAVAVVAAARELGVLRFRLPQPRRQTKESWAKVLGPRKAAVLWGLDIGTAVSTRFTFAGTWPLVLLPFLLAGPALGAIALLAFWVGRAAPVWVAPPLVDDRTSVISFIDAIAAQHRLFRLVHAAGLLLLVAFVALYLTP